MTKTIFLNDMSLNNDKVKIRLQGKITDLKKKIKNIDLKLH